MNEITFLMHITLLLFLLLIVGRLLIVFGAILPIVRRGRHCLVSVRRRE